MAKKEQVEGKTPRFEVTVHRRHPTGVFHRAGREFSRTPTVIEGELPEAIANEPMLVVTPLGEAEALTAQN